MTPSSPGQHPQQELPWIKTRIITGADDDDDDDDEVSLFRQS
jgi:hypothetical protein